MRTNSVTSATVSVRPGWAPVSRSPSSRSFPDPQARLSRYENGHVEPSIQTLNRLARALNVSEASLLGDERAAMEEFFSVLAERGIKISSKEQARTMATKFADQIGRGRRITVPLV